MFPTAMWLLVMSAAATAYANRSVQIHSVELAARPKYATRAIYVDDDAAGVGNGRSWPDAYRNLQDALADARSGTKPAVIVVAQGVYRPDQGDDVDITPGDRYATFRLDGGVSVFGGYAGLGAPGPDERNASYQTILTGDLAGNDQPVHDPWRLAEHPSRSDNSYRVATIDGRSDREYTRLSGVSITGAAEHPPGDVEYPGAGLYVASPDAWPTVEGCSFIANAAPGIYCFQSRPFIGDCLFDDNVTSGKGAGISISGGSPHISGCTFTRNWAWEGGGLYIAEGRLQVENCTFTRNTAAGLNWADTGFGGAIRVRWGPDDSIITNCRFIENIASGGGAAHFGHTGQILPFGRVGGVLLTECTFIGNQARFAGALAASAFDLDARSCVFRQNSALGWGGAMVNSLSALTLSNCLFSGNRASVDAACIYAYGYYDGGTSGRQHRCDFDLELENCTLVGNLAPGGWTIACSSYYGSQEMDNVRISNCILDNGGAEIRNRDGAQVVIRYTNLRGGPGSVSDPCNVVTWGPGNLDVDPLFTDAGVWDPNGTPDDPNDDFWVEGDYHLKSQAGRWDAASDSWVLDDVTSPCIDAGDPNTPVADEPAPNGGIVNMGAYGGTAEASMSPDTGP